MNRLASNYACRICSKSGRDSLQTRLRGTKSTASMNNNFAAGLPTVAIAVILGAGAIAAARDRWVPTEHRGDRRGGRDDLVPVELLLQPQRLLRAVVLHKRNLQRPHLLSMTGRRRNTPRRWSRPRSSIISSGPSIPAIYRQWQTGSSA